MFLQSAKQADHNESKASAQRRDPPVSTRVQRQRKTRRAFGKATMFSVPGVDRKNYAEYFGPELPLPKLVCPAPSCQGCALSGHGFYRQYVDGYRYGVISELVSRMLAPGEKEPRVQRLPRRCPRRRLRNHPKKPRTTRWTTHSPGTDGTFSDGTFSQDLGPVDSSMEPPRTKPPPQRSVASNCFRVVNGEATC